VARDVTKPGSGRTNDPREDSGPDATEEDAPAAEERLRARKRALRAAALAARRSMDPAEVAALGAAIQEHLLQLRDYRDARTVHCYVGVKANEVPTHRILREALRSGRRLVVPRVDGDRLEHHEVRDLSELRPEAFGLLEPDPSAPRVDPREIDLAVVPGLAFDRAGNRLGLGKGYYDRFLGGTPAVKAALLYRRQLVEEVPAGEGDVTVDLLVMETGVERAVRGCTRG
jgi:5-formyltetrahydrofolate cyclo-ligase